MSTPKRDRTGEYQRLKQRCIQFNICFKCRKSKETDKWLCNACLEKTRKIDNKRFAKKKAANLCLCGQPTINGKRSCAVCLERGREYQKQQRTIHISNGGCITCGKPPAPGSVTCTNCTTRATNATLRRYNSNKSQNICPFCGRELDGKFRCNSCHADHLQRGKARWHQQRLIVLEHYGGECVCCGENDYEFLEIDHINGGGRKHRQEVGSHLIDWIINHDFPTDLRILCANCNRGFGKFGDCPHHREPTPPTSKKRIRYRRHRLSCIQHYGGKCQCCGESNWAFLEFDHIDNDGKIHRKLIDSTQMPHWLIINNFPSNIQLLCCNCNKAKGLYGTCSHTYRKTTTE